MSFKKLQIISPQNIGSPESGHIYLGRDETGLWEKYSNGEWVYIITGGTTGAGTSGTSGKDGSSGADGTFLGSSGTSGLGSSGTSGISGTNGTSGIAGTSGTSGIGTSGTSGIGTSGSSGDTGTSGTSGSSGTTGTSGSSGVDGNFYGSSGTSGFDGGYGAATRRWYATNIYPPISNGYFFGTSATYGGYSFSLIDKIVVRGIDADSNVLNTWISSWQDGTLKIEKFNNPQYFGLYNLYNGWVSGGSGVYIFTGLTCKAGNGDINDSEEYLISFVSTSNSTPVNVYFSDQNLNNNNYTIIASGSTSYTFYLPLVSSSINKILWIKRANSSGTLTVSQNGSEIENKIVITGDSHVSSFQLTSDGWSCCLHSDGYFWYVISGNII